MCLGLRFYEFAFVFVLAVVLLLLLLVLLLVLVLIVVVVEVLVLLLSCCPASCLYLCHSRLFVCLSAFSTLVWHLSWWLGLVASVA